MFLERDKRAICISQRRKTYEINAMNNQKKIKGKIIEKGIT